MNQVAQMERPEGTAIPIGPGEATGNETSRAIMHEIEDELTIELASDGIVEALGDLGDCSMVRDPFATLCALRLICAICPLSGAALAARDDFASSGIWVIGRDTSDGRRPVASGFARLERRVSEAVYRAIHGAAEAA